MEQSTDYSSDLLVRAIESLAGQDAATRVAAFNAVTRALRQLVSDVIDEPVLGIQILPAEQVVANDYNPNRVAQTELDLLEVSMREDGITMPVVVVRDEAADRWPIVDGFHRRTVSVTRLHRRYLPCTVIDKPLEDRIASTIRHNRARGKHVVSSMGDIVRMMMDLGCDDAHIAHHLGMSEEELLRLKQIVGAAKLMANAQYSRSWGTKEERK